METERELQSGYLTGTEPTAAKRPKREGEGIQSIHTLPTICSLMCVCVCVSLLSESEAIKQLYTRGTDTTQRSSVLLVHTVTNGQLKMLKCAGLLLKEHSPLHSVLP